MREKLQAVREITGCCTNSRNEPFVTCCVIYFMSFLIISEVFMQLTIAESLCEQENIHQSRGKHSVNLREDNRKVVNNTCVKSLISQRKSDSADVKVRIRLRGKVCLNLTKRWEKTLFLFSSPLSLTRTLCFLHSIPNHPVPCDSFMWH